MAGRVGDLYVPVQKIIINYWLPKTGLAPGAILLFINERTLRYGKVEENIPERHFLDGVYGSDGQGIHGGIPVGKTTLWKSIANLRQEGLVTVIEIPHKWSGSRYSLNVERIMAPELNGWKS